MQNGQTEETVLSALEQRLVGKWAELPEPMPLTADDFVPDRTRLEQGRPPYAGELAAEAIEQCGQRATDEITAMIDRAKAEADSLAAEGRAIIEDYANRTRELARRIEVFTTRCVRDKQLFAKVGE